MNWLHLLPQLLLLLIAWEVFPLPLLSQPASPRPIHFRIQPESQLYLEGRSNLRDFACLSTEQFGEQSAIVSIFEEQVSLKTNLAISIQKMDCGNPGINRDMRSALQEDRHPFILIQVSEVSGPHHGPDSPGWQPFTAKVSVTIAGQRQSLLIPVQARNHSNESLQLKGSCPLKMSSFGIEPPTALFGLVKVCDDIEIFFDLRIAVH